MICSRALAKDGTDGAAVKTPITGGQGTAPSSDTACSVVRRSRRVASSAPGAGHASHQKTPCQPAQPAVADWRPVRGSAPHAARKRERNLEGARFAPERRMQPEGGWA